jgi:hypothetical protein
LLGKEAEVRRFSLREMQRNLLGVCLRSGEGLQLQLLSDGSGAD